MSKERAETKRTYFLYAADNNKPPKAYRLATKFRFRSRATAQKIGKEHLERFMVRQCDDETDAPIYGERWADRYDAASEIIRTIKNL